jgi:hypothetical protein
LFALIRCGSRLDLKICSNGKLRCEVDATMRQEHNSRGSATKLAALAAGWLLCSHPAGAAPTSCQRELGRTDITLIKSILQLRGVQHAPEGQQCEAYRLHVVTVSKVRDVFERCLAGATRDLELRGLDGTLDEANTVIARVCVR